MYRNYVPAVSLWEYKVTQEEGNRASKNAKEYREKYLELRKAMRDYFWDIGITPTDDIKKMIGMK
jgi:DNA-binding ferritin-like protein (Dps family)